MRIVEPQEYSVPSRLVYEWSGLLSHQLMRRCTLLDVIHRKILNFDKFIVTLWFVENFVFFTFNVWVHSFNVWVQDVARWEFSGNLISDCQEGFNFL